MATERAVHGLLAAAGLGVLGLDDVFGLFEQVGDASGAEVVEGGALVGELVEVIAAELVAEEVGAGAVGAGDGPLG